MLHAVCTLNTDIYQPMARVAPNPYPKFLNLFPQQLSLFHRENASLHLYTMQLWIPSSFAFTNTSQAVLPSPH